MKKTFFIRKICLVCTRFFLTGLTLVVFPLIGKSQLTVNTALTPTQLVQNVLVGGGVTVSNVTYNGGAGTIGHFTTGATSTNLGIGSGIVMSTGVVNGSPAIGSPGSNFASSSSSGLSDPDLANLIPGYSVLDASVLQFDFIPLSDTIRFRYVFGSEEYPEWVGSSYNDVFGFFVTGPNPAGGNYTNKNVALIPNTSTAVTINNVNGSSYSQYYIDNQSGMTIVFDGFTTVLTAWCKVIPCLNYHIKLAIGDAGDQIYDSAVFLEENSFTSNAVAVSTTFTTAVDTMAVEGCNDAIVHFSLTNPATSPYTINYTIGGTAQNGLDYTTIPASVTIPTGQTSASITISPYLDGISEITETVVLVIQTSVCGNTQTYTIHIRDNTAVDAIGLGDTLICGGQASILMTATGGIPPYTYLWNNGLGTSPSPTVSPASTTLYTATVTDACGAMAIDNVLVTVGGGFANAGNDTSICSGSTANLLAIGGSAYHWSNNVNTASNQVSPLTTTTYYVTVTGSCDGIDSVTVFVNPAPIVTAITSNDSICSGQQTTLTASAATTYLWTSTPTDPSLSGQQTLTSPSVSPTVTTVYTVTGTDNNTCVNTATVIVYIKPNPTAAFSINPANVCIGENTTISFTGNATVNATYIWDFNGGSVVSGTGAGPYQINWPLDGNKIVTLSIDDFGCISNVANNAVLVSPNPTANFDGTNTDGCVPLVVYFRDSSTSVNANTTYLWDFGNGQTSTLQNPAYTYVNPGTFNVSLTVFNGNDCFDSKTINAMIHAYPKPNASIYTNPDIVSEFDPVIYFYDQSSGIPAPSIWQWSLGDGDSSFVQNFVHTYQDTGHYVVTLTVYNSYGCVDSETTTVYVKPDNTLFVPNTFTPNNDQKNDVFRAYGINLLKFNMKIFNRWGNMVYNSDDINEGWDGKYNGIKAGQDTYTWCIYYTDAVKKEHIIYGRINLYR